MTRYVCHCGYCQRRASVIASLTAGGVVSLGLLILLVVIS